MKFAKLYPKTDAGSYPIIEAGNQLKHFIDEHDDLLSQNKDMRRPVVVLAFDEVHALMDSSGGRNWTIYSELRRCLSELVDIPIFTLFISTADNFQLISHEGPANPSLGNKKLLPPIPDNDFDHFAFTAKEGEITLDRVVEDEWICRLGRPLYVFLACAP